MTNPTLKDIRAEFAVRSLYPCFVFATDLRSGVPVRTVRIDIFSKHEIIFSATAASEAEVLRRAAEEYQPRFES